VFVCQWIVRLYMFVLPCNLAKPWLLQFGLPCHTTSRDGFIFHARNLNGICFSKWDLILLVVAVSFC
jgi:hypothetical protein